MQKKTDNHIFTGMQVDYDVTKHKAEVLVDAHNIRFTTRGDNTLLAITNEKGTEKESNLTFTGKYLGHAIVGNYLVTFTTDPSGDYIYRSTFDVETNAFTRTDILYKGKLNFSNRIETYSLYENENIQKVYWVDGVNQGRVINVVKSELDDITLSAQRDKYDDESFDFIQELALNEIVNIKLVTGVTGVFPAGVVQYAFNYYNKYGQETNLAYVSPLYYTTFPTRGGSPEETISVGFQIDIANLDTRFDYLRLYSIFRTSIDSVPQIKVLKDFRTSNTARSTTVNTSITVTSVTEVKYIEPSEDTTDIPESDNPSTTQDTQAVSNITLVDLGLSVKWADRNLGAVEPEDVGHRYSWGTADHYAYDNSEESMETSIKPSEHRLFSSYKSDNTPTYSIPKKVISGDANYDAAAKLSNGKLMMPTEAMIEELLTKCTFQRNIVDGYPLGIKVTGPNGNHIVIPDHLYKYQIQGYCKFWSGTYDNRPLHAEDYWAYRLAVAPNSDDNSSLKYSLLASEYINHCFPIRPVEYKNI